MTVLAVGGCSYSDYTQVDKVYGEYCAEELGLEYKHYARGGSSIPRMFYALTKAIENNELKRGDVVVLQYTDPHRKLIPEPFPPVTKPGCTEGGPGQVEVWQTPYGEAYTTDYKTHSWQWQPNNTAKTIHRELEKAFNNEFETDYAMALNMMFIGLAETKGIEIVPFECRFIDHVVWEGKQVTKDDVAGPIRDRLPPNLQNRLFRELDFLRVGNEENPTPTDIGFNNIQQNNKSEKFKGPYDGSHLSILGHETIGRELAAHIKRHKVLDSI